MIQLHTHQYLRNPQPALKSTIPRVNGRFGSILLTVFIGISDLELIFSKFIYPSKSVQLHPPFPLCPQASLSRKGTDHQAHRRRDVCARRYPLVSSKSEINLPFAITITLGTFCTCWVWDACEIATWHHPPQPYPRGNWIYNKSWKSGPGWKKRTHQHSGSNWSPGLGSDHLRALPSCDLRKGIRSTFMFS